MSQNKYLTYRGDIRAVTGHGAAVLFTTVHPESQPTALYRLNAEGATLEQVAQHEQELQKHNKTYEFHMYPKAGHGFFYYDRPAYRQEQAVDGWQKVFAFLEKYLK